MLKLVPVPPTSENSSIFGTLFLFVDDELDVVVLVRAEHDAALTRPGVELVERPDESARGRSSRRATSRYGICSPLTCVLSEPALLPAVVVTASVPGAAAFRVEQTRLIRVRAVVVSFRFGWSS